MREREREEASVPLPPLSSTGVIKIFVTKSGRSTSPTRFILEKHCSRVLTGSVVETPQSLMIMGSNTNRL